MNSSPRTFVKMTVEARPRYAIPAAPARDGRAPEIPRDLDVGALAPRTEPQRAIERVQAGRGCAGGPFEGQQARVGERVEIVEGVGLLGADRRVRRASGLWACFSKASKSSELRCAVAATPKTTAAAATPAIPQPARAGHAGSGPGALRRPKTLPRIASERDQDAQRLEAEVEDAVHEDREKTGDERRLDLVAPPVAEDAPSDQRQHDAGEQEEEEPAAVDQELQGLVFDESEPHRKRHTHGAVDGEDAIEGAPPDPERVRREDAQPVAPQVKSNVRRDAVVLKRSTS